MKIKEGDKFTNPDYNSIIVCLTNKIDGSNKFGFFGGSDSFFCLRLSKIKKKNGWKRA